MAWRVIQGDAREKIWELEPNSVDMVMTSPPYYGLRDYGCKEQIGLEASPEEYIEQLLLVFDGVARALKPTGTCWVNIGDTYYGGGQGHKPSEKSIYAERGRIPDRPDRNGTRRRDGWKRRKQLLDIPARFSIAMQERGWILRNKIVWYKPNAMPSSARDRFSNCYEFLFFFTLSEQYWFDLDTVRVPHSPATLRRGPSIRQVGANGSVQYRGENTEGRKRKAQDGKPLFNPLGRNPGDVWTIPTCPFPGAHFAVYPEALCEKPILAGCPPGGTVLDPFAGRGTTLMVAERLGRHSIGIELNPAYVEMIRRSMETVQWPMFA